MQIEYTQCESDESGGADLPDGGKHKPTKQFIRDLSHIAQIFRAAVELSDRKILGNAFPKFPHGCCGDTCILLGTYFIRSGIEQVSQLSGFRGGRSHAWLIARNVIVDITADQFDDFPARVFVGTESPWHESFNRLEISEVDFRKSRSLIWDPKAAFDEITKHIDSHGGEYAEKLCYK